jgi:cytochrome c oxidase subunit IV
MTAETTTHLITPESDVAHVKRIWKAFWVLLILTILELALGLTIYNINLGANPNETVILFIKGVIIILTLAKAFYIISIFMHLGDELRAMIMSIAIPASLFIWFIIAFIADGNAYKNARNTDAGSRPYIEQKQHVPVQAPLPAEKTDRKLN